MLPKERFVGPSATSPGAGADRLPSDAPVGVTVVVPVGPGDTVAPALRRQLSELPDPTEVRVVCVDAADAARVAGDSARWHVLTAPRGRAVQQNAGARDAAHPWLWFLHADSRLAPATWPALCRFVAHDHATLGYFDLRFDDGPALMAATAAGVWFRSHVLGLPFGDQGFVVSRTVFATLGGFDPTITRGEDHDLVWRARRAGIPLRPLGAPLYTSARKYAEGGWWRTTSGHLRETWHQARRFARPETPE